MLFASDTFTDTNGTLLSAHTGEVGATWTRTIAGGSGWTQDIDIQSNRGRPKVADTTQACGYYASGLPSVPDYDVMADVNWTSGSLDQVVQVVGRGAADYDTAGYRWGRYDFGGDWELIKMVVGTSSLLAASATPSTVTGTTYSERLVLRGTTVRGYVDGVQKVSVTDTSHAAAGRVGLVALGGNTSNGWQFDNFQAFDINDPFVHFQPIPFQGRGRNL